MGKRGVAQRDGRGQKVPSVGWVTKERPSTCPQRGLHGALAGAPRCLPRSRMLCAPAGLPTRSMGCRGSTNAGAMAWPLRNVFPLFLNRKTANPPLPPPCHAIPRFRIFSAILAGGRQVS
jgi:hypothetical protein